MIVVFGTINVDMVTEVVRFPVPGETIKGQDYVVLPGGKGANQALAAARAGAAVRLCGAVGKDWLSEVALANLRQAGVDLALVQPTRSATGICMIAIDPSGENLMICANAANDRAKTEWLEGALHPGITFLTQNSLGTADVEVSIAMAREAGCRIVYNAAPAERVSEATIAAADVLIVNEHEARTYAEELGLAAEPPGFAASLAARTGKAVVVTLGPAGVVAAFDGRLCRADPPAIQAIDTTGAGDAFSGVLAASLDLGNPLEKAILDGIAAGSLACLGIGAQTSFRDRAEIETLAAGLHLEPLSPG
ncbi:MAG: PfkB family carbohydrate kinase [Ancalomicrobiaceae bacterium]|nr:PfkB family carbohydrate kinase [Ancalomicrobiaceae bacterium]